MKKRNQNTSYNGIVRFSSVCLVVLLSLLIIYYSYLLYQKGDIGTWYIASITLLIIVSISVLYSTWRHLTTLDIVTQGFNPAHQLNTLCHCAKGQASQLGSHLVGTQVQMGDGRRIDVAAAVEALDTLTQRVHQLTLHTENLASHTSDLEPSEVVLEHQQLDTLIHQIDAAEHELYALKLIAAQAGIEQSPSIADNLTTLEDILIELHDLTQNYLQPHLVVEEAQVEAELTKPQKYIGKRKSYAVSVRTNFFGPGEALAFGI